MTRLIVRGLCFQQSSYNGVANCRDFGKKNAG